MELCRFADKRTRHPADIEKAYVDRLREAGWDDAAILERVLGVAIRLRQGLLCWNGPHRWLLVPCGIRLIEGPRMLVQDLNKQECCELLKRLGFGRLGCASKNQPYIVPIYFAYEPDCLFAFSTVGQKIEWMRKNPRVCVEADEVVGQDNWTSVLVFGRYEELTDSPKHAALRRNAHSLLDKRTLWWRPAIASSETRGEHFGPFPVFYCIHIVEITGHRSSPD